MLHQNLAIGLQKWAIPAGGPGRSRSATCEAGLSPLAQQVRKEKLSEKLATR
jgi:hypothetical protein